ncbi:hypothetical protein DDB_G0278003 [Dictyostelium discoideum AX4]|uniref:Uncharacterized protein n=1 Tax=Dictyostelium discoideum TaxID=44689 RepID=Q54YY7_DICDI|nr:hypothetical protein DDB_G0278003 [Dictyostelium discoideum AX4]EAL68174.1 hypothetical protein DDB_G0278003 [Dictyostelium discoideum AX4]|eukprot:XP_642065.1 hypothetical protein DDB_G0278003 [Dictyostelium discoideum AX4]
MTVLLEQEYKNEIDTKVFKVLVAFSQSIERSLINNQNTLHQAENSLNININTQAQAIDSSQFDSSNLGLYTVQLVRNVIKRSNDLSDEFNSLVNTITQQQQQKEKQYKDEIQFLKSRIEQLSNNNNNNTNTNNTNTNNIYNENNNNNSNNIIKIDKLENISLDENSKENNINNNNNNEDDKQNAQKQSSPIGSSLSVSNKEPNLDWDTKYQTELQLNAMLSEFLKDDFEISNLSLGVSDEVSSTTSPSISTTSTANTGLGSSGSFSPNSNTTSPSLNLSNSSTNSLSTTVNNSNSNSNTNTNNNNNSNSNSASGGGSDKTQQNVQKKAMLTDLLDQIDLDSGSNTPSKQKKGKFKFF